MHRDVGHVARIEWLAGRGLLRPGGDRVHRILFGEKADVRRARERDGDALLALVAQPVADPGREPLVGDADVLADPQTRDRRERPLRRLQDEAHRARLALRCELVVDGVEKDGVGSSGAEAVLEERAPRDVVLEELGQAALPRAHGLVDRLRFLLGGLADQDLAGLFGPAQGFVLRLGPSGQRIDEVRRRRVQIPLDHRSALHVDEDRAGVPTEDVLVVAVDVVVTLLPRRGTALREDPLGLEQRGVRVGPQVREVDPAEHAVPVDVIPLCAPEVLLRLTDLRRRVENAAARELFADDEHPLVQPV